MVHRRSRLAFLLTLLLLVGAGCNWSDMSDEERAAARQALSAAAVSARPATFGELVKKTPDEIRAMGRLRIRVLTSGSDVFPFPDDQLKMTAPDRCESVHYHGTKGLTLDLRFVDQSPVDPCGFGSQVSDQEVDAEAIIQWFRKGPNAK